MSYGMMIAVQLDKKHEFDALWNWSRPTCSSLIRIIPSFGSSPGR